MAHRDTESYRFRYPGLPLKAVKFFDMANSLKTGSGIQPRSVQEFINTYQVENPIGGNLPQPGAVDAICDRLCRAGYLTFTGAGPGVNLGGMTHCYMCHSIAKFDEVTLSRSLDCAVYGFPCIYDVFKSSVVPIIHTTASDKNSIGTGFVIGPTMLQTAAHCIDGAKRLAIRGVTALALSRARLFRSTNDAVDLGLIWFDLSVFSDTPPIKAGIPILLQDVMALGYPDVPGFQPALAAEKAMISSRLTAVRGSVASAPFEIWAQTELLLITARVRGGFSGGPILNENGDYVGVVARSPTHQVGDHLDDAIHSYDNLGYGTAIPSTVVEAFLHDVSSGTCIVAKNVEMQHTMSCDFE